MGNRVDDFNQFRAKMNERILQVDNKTIKRFFSVDTMAYQEGVLPAKTKEMLGLVASLVLHCDDCIAYHLQKCRQYKVSSDEFFEVFSIALVVGGSIVIPHLRRAVAFLDEMNQKEKM